MVYFTILVTKTLTNLNHMKKIILLLSTLCYGLSMQSQIQTKFKKSTLQEFKGTETVFILSDLYAPEEYEEMLENAWTVTPFTVVAYDQFKMTDYLDGKHSFVFIEVEKMTTDKGGKYLYCYLDFVTYDVEAKKKEIAKLRGKSDRKTNIFSKNQNPILRIMLFPENKFLGKAITGGLSANTIYNDDVFYTYKPGFLRNFFQEASTILTEGKEYDMQKDYVKPEITKLQNATLYMPSYTTINYNPYLMDASTKGEEDKTELMSKYKYKYEYIDNDELSKKIMNKEDIYYLRFTRVNAWKLIQVVNAKTGNIVYNSFNAGLNYQLNDGHLKDVSKAVEKGK